MTWPLKQFQINNRHHYLKVQNYWTILMLLFRKSFNKKHVQELPVPVVVSGPLLSWEEWNYLKCDESLDFFRRTSLITVTQKRLLQRHRPLEVEKTCGLFTQDHCEITVTISFSLLLPLRICFLLLPDLVLQQFQFSNQAPLFDDQFLVALVDI